jgi:hypothetical protein
MGLGGALNSVEEEDGMRANDGIGGSLAPRPIEGFMLRDCFRRAPSLEWRIGARGMKRMRLMLCNEK